MSEIPVVNQIQHYQRSIEKYPDDEPRVLRCIRKLHDLPVTVQHLQETGVGRTVNALRKYDGTVGDAAKALVAKWKIMVVDEESSDCDDDDDNCVPDVSGGYTDNSDSGVDKDESHTRTLSSHKLSESHERSSNSRHESRSSKHSSNNSSDLSRSKSSNKSNTDNNDRRRHHSKSSSSSSSSSSINNNDKLEDTNTRHDSREKKSKSHRESSSKSDRHSSRKDDNISNNSSNKTVKKDKDKESSKVSSHDYSKHNGHSSSDRKRKRDSSANEKHVDKRRRSSTVDESDDEDKSVTDTNEISDNECDKIKINIKSESPESPPRVYKSKETVSVKKEKSKDKTGDSGDKSRDDKHKHSSSSSKHKVKSDSSKSSEHRRQEKKKDELRESSACKSRGHSTSSSKDTDRNKHSEKSKEKKSPDSKDKDKDKSKDKDKKHKEKKSKKFNGHEGIDCNSGASFAEALGMCTASTSFSRKKIPTSPIISIKSNKPEAGTSAQKTDKIKTESSSPKDEEILHLLSPNIKLKPLNVDLASTLPEISANYKPLPVNNMNPIYRRMEEDKALNDAIYAKNIRTKVYSGNKTSYTSVPSLYELCIRVLIENIEALECTGGVPYYLLKPVLERATADQLFMIEHYNPYLIEDTDTLWKFHCNREFRNREREEMESWREMYMRCLDEREAKLKTLTANIKQSIDKSLPARSTIMAYVDDVVKPPRNVLRKQARYGTSSATSSSDIKKKIILTSGTNAATNVSVPAPPMSRVKSSTSGIVKKNKAPLMAKALQLIKGRYKR